MSRKVQLLVSLAVGSVACSAFAGTKTWSGAVAFDHDSDPTTPSYFLWDATTLNWLDAGNPAAFVPADTVNAIPGDDVIFTDAPGVGTDISVAATMNPNSITFVHSPGNTTPINYVFYRGADTLPLGSTNPVITGGNSPFAAGSLTANLTIDTGFLGKVTLRPRANSAARAPGGHFIRSGQLELNDALALPGSTASGNPLITLDGAELLININTAGNTQPASSNLTGQLTVASNSFLTLNRDNAEGLITGSRLYNGPVVFATPSTVLEVKSNFPDMQMNLGANFTASQGILRVGEVSGVAQTLRLDSGNAQGPGLTLDFGSAADTVIKVNVGTAIIATATTVPSPRVYSIGNLVSTVPTQRLEGATSNNASIEYQIGALGVDSTVAASIVDGTGFQSGLNPRVPRTYLNKVGAGTLSLTNNNTVYSGTTTVTAGKLVMTLPIAEATVLDPTKYFVDDDENPDTEDNPDILNYAVGGLNVLGGQFVIDYTGGSSPAAQVLSLLSSGYAAGFASGQFRSSLLPAGQTLGWIDNAATSQLAIGTALPGDTNLVGGVGFEDLLSLAQNYGGTGKVWSQGDFDYDGSVSFNDLLALAQNYGVAALSGEQIDQLYTVASPEVAALVMTVVPEPTTLGLLAASGLLLARRRH